MESDAMSIGELADAAGLTRRAVRFYVQQKLLPAPTGRGRGSHYEPRHLDQLRRVIELQQAGHSLDAIRQLLAESAPDSRASREHSGSAAGPSARKSKDYEGNDDPEPAHVRAELWTRLKLGEGIELTFDATKHNPTVEQLLELRHVIREALLE